MFKPSIKKESCLFFDSLWPDNIDNMNESDLEINWPDRSAKTLRAVQRVACARLQLDLLCSQNLNTLYHAIYCFDVHDCLHCRSKLEASII